MAFFHLVVEKKRARWLAFFLVCGALLAGLFVYPDGYNAVAVQLNRRLGIADKTIRFPQFRMPQFRLGLDVSGGTSLIYRADVSGVVAANQSSAMEGLKDVLERRVNLFGVQEPRVEVSHTEGEWRLIVELAGVKDISQAIAMIGETPYLEFREQRDASTTEAILAQQKANDLSVATTDPLFIPTDLTGRYLTGAQVQFDPNTYQPTVGITFGDEGAKIFETLTSRNIGKRLAIYIDGVLISAPTVQDTIPSGSAVITGRFTPQQAKDLANNLNQGALPVPIELISQRSVEATLGLDSLNKMVFAGFIGFCIVAAFMVLFYRIGGLFSVFALLIYIPLVLTIFKLVPVTLTLSGIAGFILSIGMAVDANILILERSREELRSGKEVVAAVKEGFNRAWPSIRDSNMASIITALVLYGFTASIVRGFALTLLVGVLASMFSAIFVSRTFILAFLSDKEAHSKLWFRP